MAYAVVSNVILCTYSASSSLQSEYRIIFNVFMLGISPYAVMVC